MLDVVLLHIKIAYLVSDKVGSEHFAGVLPLLAVLRELNLALVLKLQKGACITVHLQLLIQGPLP